MYNILTNRVRAKFEKYCGIDHIIVNKGMCTQVQPTLKYSIRPVKVNFLSFRQLGEPIMLQVQVAGCTLVQLQAL